MIIISAMTSDRVIGSRDGLPWDVPEEYAQYLRLVEGQTVIMGRRSYDIFGDDLTSAHTIVVSRSMEAAPGLVICGSIAEAAEMANTFGKTVFSAGGATIYRQTLPLADTMYLSFIKGDYTGDTYFPDFDETAWTITHREDHPAFEFIVYERH